MKTSGIAFILSLAALNMVTCKKDADKPTLPPQVKNEEEVITTLTIMLSDSSGINPEVNATFQDPDGDGGKGPDIHDTIILADSTTYFASILLLNETETPADTISNEVLEEGDQHLFCFTTSDVNLTIHRTDSDGSYEVGLKSTWRTSVAGYGTVRVVLKHQPGVKNGKCDPGETDVDVIFQIRIE